MLMLKLMLVGMLNRAKYKVLKDIKDRVLY